MAILFRCSGCGRELRAQDDAAGRQARCPQCGTISDIPDAATATQEQADAFVPHAEPAGAPGALAGPPPVPPVPPGATRRCPYCDETIPADSTKCSFCGEFLETGAATAPARGAPPPAMSPKAQQLKIPAIILIVFGSLGTLSSLQGALSAMVAQAPAMPPNMPPQLQQMQWLFVGPGAVAINLFFLLLNGTMLAGAIQMLRFRSYALAMTAAILSLLDLSCCCLLTMPFGIWALVLLSDAQVKAAFH